MFVPASIVLEAFNAVVTLPDGARLTIVKSLNSPSTLLASVIAVPVPSSVVKPALNVSSVSSKIHATLFESPRSPIKPMSFDGTPVSFLARRITGSSIIVLTVSKRSCSSVNG